MYLKISGCARLISPLGTFILEIVLEVWLRTGSMLSGMRICYLLSIVTVMLHNKQPENFSYRTVSLLEVQLGLANFI